MVRKIRQKRFRVSHFALLLVIFKWHLGSEGVKLAKSLRQSREWCIHTLPSQEGQAVQVLLGCAGRGCAQLNIFHVCANGWHFRSNGDVRL